MTKPAFTQPQKRFQESLAALFLKIDANPFKTCLFLKSSTDVGVIRNGGRNGARFAPQSLLSCFKKLSQNSSLKNYQFLEVEVASKSEEENNFHLAQIQEGKRIRQEYLTSIHAKICHIGGGHDHIYPLLSAVGQDFKKVIIINVDAHADTRTDENYHSGTPFRQFSNDFEGEIYLYQFGLHPYSNSFSTLSDLKKGKMSILWKKNLCSTSIIELFKNIKSQVEEKTLVVFSLDADALCASEVPGVSAVNPDGLSRQELMQIWENYSALPLHHPTILGIYELNPIYDTLASLSMRSIASFIYETLNENKDP